MFRFGDRAATRVSSGECICNGGHAGGITAVGRAPVALERDSRIPFDEQLAIRALKTVEMEHAQRVERAAIVVLRGLA